MEPTEAFELFVESIEPVVSRENFVQKSENEKFSNSHIA